MEFYMFLEYTVIDNKYKNINQILQNELNLSNRLLHKVISNNLVLLNNKNVDTRSSVSVGDYIKVDLNYEENSDNVVPTQIKLDIVYEDDWLLIINKPAGIAVHPSILHFDTTLSNGVKFYFNEIGLKKKIRPVNRLDLNTSGLIIFAKNEYIQESLIQQMDNHIFQKEYFAVVSGILEIKNGTINLLIGRKENSIIERCVCTNGQPSITNYTVIKEFNNMSLVKCNLQTGRTHQIRVHFSSIGHPLIGDSLYGSPSKLINRQALHCCHISFYHPILKSTLNFISDLPEDIKELVENN